MPGCGEVHRSIADAADGIAVIATTAARAPALHRKSNMHEGSGRETRRRKNWAEGRRAGADSLRWRRFKRRADDATNDPVAKPRGPSSA